MMTNAKVLKKAIPALLALVLALTGSGALSESVKATNISYEQETLPFWKEGSPALTSVMTFVRNVTDPDSEAYVEPSDRIAVFDFDGTLYGERFPTYFDNCLFLQRALHDESYAAAEDVRTYAEELESARDERGIGA